MIGTRVVCVKDDLDTSDYIDESLEVKVGKIYTITHMLGQDNRRMIIVESDDGRQYGWFKVDYFKPLSECREDKLNELLDV